MRTLAAALALLLAPQARAADPRAPAPRPEPTAEAPPSRLAPVSGATASVHGPYASGDCAVCHAQDEKRVGPARKPASPVCLECHGELGSAAEAKRMKHPAPGVACTSCHNPHNSARRSLLL